MSDFNLIDIVNLIRAEIRKTQVGPLKKVVGPAGEQGPQGEAGIQGPQGPRGNDGKQGPAGTKGNQGKKGDKGAKGDDGSDGVGIARVEQDIDNAIVVYLTDGNSYTIEMPLIQEDGSLAREVHYKSGGGGGSGVIDLSNYVKRPSNTHGGKWLLYREPDGTNQGEWAPATTDLIETNGMIMFRDINGRFAPTPEELDELNTQLKVNRFMWEKIQELDLKAGGVAISDEAPADPENGMFWFDNSEDVMQLFIWHEDSDAWLPVAPPTTLEGRVSAGEATQQAIIAQINESLQVQADIMLKVGELEVSKGSVARYKVMGTEFNVASRAGELYVSSPDASQVVNISLAILDLDDNPTKPCHEDDIIEFDWPDGGVARYQVVSGESQGLVVSYLSGTHTFEADQELETYVYPQNKGSASIDYVDAQDDLKLDKTGGTVTGDIAMSGKRITGLGDPTSNAHAATKKYVDQRNTNGISTQLWKYCEGKDRSELKAREFTVNFVNGDKDQIEIYIYPYLNGRWWAPAINTNYTHQIGETYCTISDWQGACAIGFKGLKWWFIQQAYDSNGTKRWHNALQGNYYKLAYPETYRLKDQHWYNLNLPSPFPLVNFPEEVHTGGMGATFGIDPEEAPVPPDAIDMGEVLP